MRYDFMHRYYFTFLYISFAIDPLLGAMLADKTSYHKPASYHHETANDAPQPLVNYR